VCKKISFCFKENTVYLLDKNPLVNAVKEIIAVYNEKYMEHLRTLYGQNAKLLNVKVCGTRSYHLVL
jgi:hypothetical protein